MDDNEPQVKVPRWLELQEQIDYLYFVLSQIQKQMPKSNLETLIDDVTGYEKARKQEIKEVCIEMKKLKAEWSKETGEEASTQMEDEIIRLCNA